MDLTVILPPISLILLFLCIGDNICVKNNGGCEQLCFATAMVNRTCQCESHYTLNPADNTSCIRKFFCLSLLHTLREEILGNLRDLMNLLIIPQISLLFP